MKPRNLLSPAEIEELQEFLDRKLDRIGVPSRPEVAIKLLDLSASTTSTMKDYAEIIRYATDRFMTVVPEIDMPGHTNAALASYAELNCDGKAPPLYTGTAVGFSSLCISKEITYRFVDDVIREDIVAGNHPLPGASRRSDGPWEPAVVPRAAL